MKKIKTPTWLNLEVRQHTEGVWSYYGTSFYSNERSPPYCCAVQWIKWKQHQPIDLLFVVDFVSIELSDFYFEWHDLLL